MSSDTDRREKGAALPTIAIMLVVLLGMAAFAVDLGWLFLNGNRIQKTADAAALAGVVNMPSDITQAYNDANAAVTANGFGGATMVAIPKPDNSLQVDVTSTVDTFFMNVFGIGQVDITRRATAQYILPVPLGNDSSCFGCSGSGFWASINGPRTDAVDGDAFNSDCFGNKNNGSTCPTPNPFDRGTGYFYGIEIPAGANAANLRVRIYNGTYDPTGFDPTQPSDQDLGTNGSLTTTFTLRRPDSTPYYPNDNPSACTQSVPANTNGWRNWNVLCTVNNPADGIWVLQVEATGTQQGSNQFSIDADISGTAATPRVYGLNDMSLFNNRLGTVSAIKLAEIDSVHAGKTLEVGLYDPGDISGGSGNIFLDVKSPSGLVDCSWYGQDRTGSTFGSHSEQACHIQVRSSSGNQYNGSWVRITIDIPSTYSCTSDCWWYVDYDLTGLSGSAQPTDRTVWTARVIGNPIRLIPNAP